MLYSMPSTFGRNIMRSLLAAGLICLAAACAYPQPKPQVEQPPASEHDRLAFIQGTCGDCHAVEGEAISPNPMAPTFASIANREGLTETTLGTWLRDAHNYPEMMDFDLSPEQAEMIAAHMLTLRDPRYKPLPD